MNSGVHKVVGKPAHPEAFCHMTYREIDDDGNETAAKVSIWNSRDGVTPFIVCVDGKEHRHADWASDRSDPGYAPKVGDLIWADATLDGLIDERLAWLEDHWNDPDFRTYITSEYGDNKIPAAEKMAEHDLTEHGEPPPSLVKVTREILRGFLIARRGVAP